MNPAVPSAADVIKREGRLTSGEAVHTINAGAEEKPDSSGSENGRKTGFIFHNIPVAYRAKRREMMTTIKIKGMTCNHCVMAVTKALGGIEGIRDVQVDLQKGEAAFTEEKPVDRALIRERIVKAGFKVVD
jgi:copper chaperone